MAQFLQIRSVFSNFSKICRKNFKKNGHFFFKISTHFYPIHSQQNMNDASIYALVQLLLTKLDHFCNAYIHANMFFVYSKWY